MELSKQKLEDFISAADKIIEANKPSEQDLFGAVENTSIISNLLDLPAHDAQKSYDLYYRNIQPFLGSVLPKDADISSVIRELICILLSHKERSGLTYGARGADSRMASSEDMVNLMDALTEWSDTPTDHFRLACILLDKAKELGFIPEDRSIADYIK